METLVCILAQAKFSRRLKGLEDAFKQANTESPDRTVVVLLVVVILSIVLALLITRRMRRRKSGELFANKPYKLFSWALKKLGMGWTDRAILRYAARQCNLRQPTVMLFSEELLQRTVGQWTDTISFTPLRSHAKNRLAVLAERAFA